MRLGGSRRFRLSLLAILVTAPALAQENSAGHPLADRMAANAEALARYRPLDDGVWATAGLSRVDDRRPGLSRSVTTQSLLFGYDHRIVSPFTANDQLVLGLAGGLLNAASRIDAQHIRVDSRAWSASAYGIYAPWLFLSFPVAVTIGRWTSDQTRDGTPLLPTYRASYNSTSFASSIGAALTLPVSRFLVTTSVSHRYNSNNRPDYIEAINPAATDFQTTPSDLTESSQLVGTLRLALPFDGGRVWGSAGYAYDLKSRPAEDTRSEFPLGIGFDFFSPRFQLGAAAHVVLRDDITAYTGSLTGRLQF